jgi:hypothetical protein
MKKAIYSSIIVLITLPIMNIGFNLEQEPLLINGIFILQIVIPAFTFMLTNLFVLLFDKEKDLKVIIGTSLSIILIADLITIIYFSLGPNLYPNGQGFLLLLCIAILIAFLNVLSLHLYRILGSHHPKHSSGKLT